MTLNLEAIKARCEKATSPPWVFNPKATGGEVQPSLASHAESLGDLAPMPITTGTPFWSDSDFHFIAHARTDLPALVAEVERLRKVEAAAEALLGPWDDEWDCSGSPGHPQLTKAVVALRAALDAAQGGG